MCREFKNDVDEQSKKDEIIGCALGSDGTRQHTTGPDKTCGASM